MTDLGPTNKTKTLCPLCVGEVEPKPTALKEKTVLCCGCNGYSIKS